MLDNSNGDEAIVVESEVVIDEHAEITELAHTYWIERGCPEGSPEIDWQRAEEEVRERRNGTLSSTAGA